MINMKLKHYIDQDGCESKPHINIINLNTEQEFSLFSKKENSNPIMKLTAILFLS